MFLRIYKLPARPPPSHCPTCGTTLLTFRALWYQVTAIVLGNISIFARRFGGPFRTGPEEGRVSGHLVLRIVATRLQLLLPVETRNEMKLQIILINLSRFFFCAFLMFRSASQLLEFK